MSQLKISLVVLVSACLYGSCVSGEPSHIRSNAAAEISVNVADQTPVNVERETNAAADGIVNTRSESAQTKTPRSYRTKPRRTKIKFPDDCTTTVPAGEENWQLQTACAEAVTAALPNLPETARIGLSSTKSDCEYNSRRNDEDRLAAYGAEFYPLSSNKYLVKILCQAGAYNQSNSYLLYDESALPAKAEVLEFPSLQITHDEDSEIAKTVEEVTVKTVGGVYFDAKTKQLIVFVKAHGIGDAGHYARYSFPNGKPKLEELRAKFKWEGRGYTTDEILQNPPQTWKKYYIRRIVKH